MIYKDIAIDLFKKGYKPIPIRPNSKLPMFDKNESWKVEITEKTIQDWSSNGKGNGGIALTGLAALDCDIYDKAVSNALIKYLRESIPDNIMIRVGFPPKFLVPLSPNSDVKKKRKTTFYDPCGQKHEIEILAPGDQYFVSWGMHPDTGSEYQWVKGKSPLSVSVDNLPALDSLDISGIEDEFARLAREAGWTQDRPKDPKTPDPIKTCHTKLPGERSSAGGEAELRVWLSALPEEYCNDRDLWIKIGAAIHHETGGSNTGWSLFDEWSKSSPKYKGREDTIKRWESFDSSRGFSGDAATAGTIIQAIRDKGEKAWQKVKKQSDKAKAEATKSADTETARVKTEEHIAEINNKHAVIDIAGKFRVMNHITNAEGEDDITFSSVEDFCHFYGNRFAVDPDDPEKRRPVAKLWLSSSKRKQYDGVVFKPGEPKVVENRYNLWHGFSVSPKRGDWSLFRDHIINIIASENEEMGQWIMAWLARIIQDPGGEKPGTSIVLRGRQGTGKGVFVNMVGRIFGRHFLQVAHASQVTGRFNAHLKDKIMVFVDEGFWAGDKRSEGVIKSIITEPHIAIEQKGMDIIKVQNFVHLILASNSEWIVPAGFEERRFCVLDVSDAHMQDKPYFRAILNQMNNGGLEGMVYDLLNMDTSGFDLRQVQTTNGLYEQKLHTMNTIQKWWTDKLFSGVLIENPESGYRDLSNDMWQRVLAKDLYKDYMDFADKSKERYPMSHTQFGHAIKKLCPGIIRKTIRSDLKTHKGLFFPHIDECRAEYESMVKIKIDWDKDDDEEFDLF